MIDWRGSLLLAVATAAMAVRAGSAATDAEGEQRFNEAWFIEEGQRDPEKAAAIYREVEAKFSHNKDLAARALTRAAECYGKLGRTQEMQDIWGYALKNYREQIEKTRDFQDESLRIKTYIDKAMAGAQSIDLAEVFSGILEKIPPQYIIPMRDDMLKQARKNREASWSSAINSLRLAILLSMKIKDEATAAQAHSDIGRIYLEEGLRAEAVEVFFEVKNEYPNQRAVLAWNQTSVAEAFRMWARLDHALESYNHLLTTYPDQNEQVLWARLWMGDCYRDLGELQTAKQTWKEVAEDQGAKDFPRQAKLARILAGLENPPAAIDAAAKDDFANDEAYFIAIRHEMDADAPKALQWMKICRDLSAGKDWPYPLAMNWILNAGGGSGR